MSFKEKLRSVTPNLAWQTLGFINRIPLYWWEDRSANLCVRNGLSDLHLYLNEEISLAIPEDLSAYICWRTHTLDKISGAEVADFLSLADGCLALVDIGAQTGLMSAAFARSRKGPYHLLSVEPDVRVFDILKRAIELNGSAQGDWKIATLAVSNMTQTVPFAVSNTIYSLSGPIPAAPNLTVESVTMADLLARQDWVPDILKIDVESFEYEILTSSLDLLSRLKPALQLEVHWEMLAARGKSAFDFLGPLSELGYRGIRQRYYDLKTWEQAGKSSDVSRFSLRVQN